MRRGPHPILALIAAVLLAASTRAGAQTPTLTGAFPRAAHPGAVTVITLRGSNLARPLAVEGMMLPPGATVGLAPADAKAGGAAEGDGVVWKVAVGPEQQVGLGVIRIGTRNGVSNALPFMIDDLPSVAGADAHGSPETAQAIQSGCAVDAACKANASDYYRLSAKKGQRVSIEAVAARLGSQLDPVVRLLDARGNELAAVDDTGGIGPDCRFAHTFAADGEYLIELRDTNLAGGSEFFYRLRVGDFPLATVPFPLGCRTLTQPEFTFAGPDCAGAAPTRLEAVLFRRLAPLTVRYGGARGKAGGSGFVVAAVGEHEEVAEVEPNDDAAHATPLPAAPVGLSGLLEKPGDRDFFEVRVTKGQQLAFAARTRSLGSPCDVRLQLFKSDGGKLGESKVRGTDEGELTATLPAAGSYRLMVEDITRAGGPGLGYRVTVKPYVPGVSLSVDTDTVNAKPGETFELKVSSNLPAGDGGIALSVDGAGLTSEPVKIRAGQKDAVLKVKVPTGAPPGGPFMFRVLGTTRAPGGAGPDEAAVTIEASTMPAVRRLYPRLIYPPDESDGLLALGVRAPAE